MSGGGKGKDFFPEAYTISPHKATFFIAVEVCHIENPLGGAGKRRRQALRKKGKRVATNFEKLRSQGGRPREKEKSRGGKGGGVPVGKEGRAPTESS